ncbi:hypothetical protein XENOCAPTIV_008375 [Xenoophorus captivus]|uniref:Uncharacterized protein n=1 Tax=Xenoophorus captivus TaxID=1517983 RepID=A0ABV0R7P6_9TELE
MDEHEDLPKDMLEQELDFQKKRPQELGDKFVSVVSQFIAVASFSFSDVEDSLTEAKELVSQSDRNGRFLQKTACVRADRSALLSLEDTGAKSSLLVSSGRSCFYTSG